MIKDDEKAKVEEMYQTYIAMNLIPYESELMEYHNRCLNINEL